jgi:hypothetical protein
MCFLVFFRSYLRTVDFTFIFKIAYFCGKAENRANWEDQKLTCQSHDAMFGGGHFRKNVLSHAFVRRKSSLNKSPLQDSILMILRWMAMSMTFFPNVLVLTPAGFEP